ncbi:MAG: flippase [Zetaproteobacteria bacterium]|nr:MAG: flippase [Zetaproteobacteria bacterium]
MRWVINIVTNYLRSIIAMVIAFLLVPYIIGAIGKEMFGLWSLIFAVISVFGMMDFGFATAAVKYVAECVGSRDDVRRDRILSTLWVVYSVIGLICLLCVFVLAEPVGRAFDLQAEHLIRFKYLVWMLGTVVAVSFPASLFRAALMGAGRMDVANLVELVRVVVNAGLIVWLLSRGMGLMGLGIATAVTMLGASLVMIPLAYRLLPGMRISLRLYSPSEVRELLSFSAYAFIASLALLIILRIDPLVIGAFMSLSAIAVYAVAVKVSEYTYLLNKQFSNALMPLVSQSHGSGDRTMIRRVLLDGTRFLMGVTLPFLALLYFYAPDIIHIWVGDQFDESVPLLRILIVALYFSATQLNAANVLGMTGHHRFVAFCMAASAALNLILSIVLIQFYGLTGVAVATLIAAFLIEMAVMVPRACREQEISFSSFLRDGLWPGVPALAPMLLVAWWMYGRWPSESLSLLVVEGSIAALVYFVCFAFTAVRAQERRMGMLWLTRRLRRT